MRDYVIGYIVGGVCVNKLAADMPTADIQESLAVHDIIPEDNDDLEAIYERLRLELLIRSLSL